MEGIVLVQEHDKSILDVLSTALEIENFAVVTVLSCGDRILELIDRHRPHVVMLDIKLKARDCIEVCHQIKETYPHLPVIALSCNENIEAESAKEGFDSYLKKPFDIEVLYQLLRKYLPESSLN
ncbi:MAG: response regulator [Bacteroidota bacterium]